jgi:hypothetical protein
LREGLIPKSLEDSHNDDMSQSALKLSDYLPEVSSSPPPLMLADDLATDDRQLMAILVESREAAESQRAARRSVLAGFELLISAARDREPLALRVREMRETLPELLRVCATWWDSLKPQIRLTLEGLKFSRKIIAGAKRRGDTRRVLQMEEYHHLLQSRLDDARGLQANLQQLVKRYRKLLDEGAASLSTPVPLPPLASPEIDRTSLRRSIMKQIPKARAYLAK